MIQIVAQTCSQIFKIGQASRSKKRTMSADPWVKDSELSCIRIVGLMEEFVVGNVPHNEENAL